MPNYDFLNKETGEIKEYFMSYKDLDEFKKNNPHLLQQVSAPNIVGGHGAVSYTHLTLPTKA